MNSSLKKHHVFFIAMSISFLGALVSLSPMGDKLEGEYGRSWLFEIRGKIPVPEQVIIISIDKASADFLELPNDPQKWPRVHYANLINRLKQQSPSVIAFNIIFDESHDAQNDEMLATAIADANNVILSSYLQVRKYSSDADNGYGSGNYSLEQIIEPAAILQQAAINVSPFLLPKTSTTVNQFWTYKASAGDIPTFPVSVFQCYSYKNIFPELITILQEIAPEVYAQLSKNNALEIKKHTMTVHHVIRSALINSSELSSQFIQSLNKAEIPVLKKQLLQSWFSLIQSSNQLYFNHYGPGGTIKTVPFYQALTYEGNDDLFKNKIILIGYSDDLQPEKNQGFYNVFSSQNGKSISSIEIAATAVANLIDSSWLKSLSGWEKVLLIMLWGGVVVMVFGFFSYGIAIVIVILLSVSYLFISYSQFTSEQLLLPLFIPLVIQLPLAFFVVSFMTYIQNKRQQQKMQKIFSYYIPDDVVTKYSKNTNIEELSAYGELKYGVCVATDVGQYTALSENLTPTELNSLMNNYYGIMFPLVKRNGGFVSDVIGDAMLAIWAESALERNIKTRKNACIAALQIKADIEHFNKTQSNNLPTRIGLHYGDMYLGNVGTQEHFEYRATGDTINTATRIEGLSKLLGTKILVSAEVVDGLVGFIAREIGTFILKGKTRAIIIYELQGYQDDMDDGRDSLNIFFKQALALFRQHQWVDALQFFLEIEKEYPNDAPTRFYINYLQHHLVAEYPEQDLEQAAVIKLDDVAGVVVDNVSS